MEAKSLDSIFQDLENLIYSTETFSKPEKIIRETKFKIEKEFAELENSLNELKTLRMMQVDNTYSTYSEAEELLSYIRNSKLKFSGFFEKYNGFLMNDKVLDDDYFIFLQLYEMHNLGMIASQQYIEVLNQLREFYCDNDLNLESKFVSVKIEIEESIRRQKSLLANQSNLNNKLNNVLHSSFDNKSGDRNGKIYKTSKNSSKKDVNKFKASMIDREKLSENLYAQVNEKITGLENHIEDFKDYVYSSFKKENSLVEIEKIVKMFEEKTSKRMNFANKSGIKFSASTTKSGMLTRSKVSLQAIKKEKEKEVEKKIEEQQRRKSIDKVLLGEKAEQNISSTGDSPKVKPIHPTTTKNQAATHNNDLFALEEKEDEDNEYAEMKKESIEVDTESEEVDDELEVNLVKNKKNSQLAIMKLNNMFKPKPKQIFADKRKIAQISKTNIGGEDEKFKLNKKLIDLINESKRLVTLIKTKEDISLLITTIRRYYSFVTLEHTRKTNPLLSRGISSHFLDLMAEQDKKSDENTIKIIEGSNEIQIYNRKERRIQKIKAVFEKKHKTNFFYVGCRYINFQDKVYITGGKDSLGEKNLFLCYDLKNNKLIKMPDMSNARCYHSIQYHDSLKSLFVFGGENNGTCELYDFYLNMWNVIPNLNVPRANASAYIDKVGTFAYLLCGQTGSISSSPNYTDAVEFLDLVDMNQGWAKIEVKNKENIDLKFNEIKVKNVDEEKLLIYGGKESRTLKICFSLFNMKTLELQKIDEDLQEKFLLLHDT